MTGTRDDYDADRDAGLPEPTLCAVCDRPATGLCPGKECSGMDHHDGDLAFCGGHSWWDDVSGVLRCYLCAESLGLIDEADAPTTEGEGTDG